MGESEGPEPILFYQELQIRPNLDPKMTNKTQYATRKFVNRKTVFLHFYNVSVPIETYKKTIFLMGCVFRRYDFDITDFFKK